MAHRRVLVGVDVSPGGPEVAQVPETIETRKIISKQVCEVFHGCGSITSCYRSMANDTLHKIVSLAFYNFVVSHDHVIKTFSYIFDISVPVVSLL